jgi:hypothetical protein
MAVLALAWVLLVLARMSQDRELEQPKRAIERRRTCTARKHEAR